MKYTKIQNRLLLNFFLSLALVLLLFLKAAPVYTDTTDNINATIKISICGNGEIEGGEDCEGENLNGQTCESLGYGPGTLVCDIACSFDTYGCSPAPSPTPTPTPTPTATPTLTPTSAPNPTSVPTSAPEQVTALAPTSVPAATTQVFTTGVAALRLPAIPEVIALFFDIDGSGRIEIVEIFEAVKVWVEDWRKFLQEEFGAEKTAEEAKSPKKCDLNRDNTCNLRDLSILLYYIGR